MVDTPGVGGDTCSIHDRGLRMELHIANPPPKKKKNYTSPKVYSRKKTWHQNFLPNNNTRLKYLNTDYSIKQTLLMHDFASIVLMKLVCLLMSLHPPLCSTSTHRSSSLGDV